MDNSNRPELMPFGAIFSLPSEFGGWSGLIFWRCGFLAALAATKNVFAQRTTANSAQESKIAGCSAISSAR